MKKHHYGFAMAWGCSWILTLLGGAVYAIVEHISLGLGEYWALATVTTAGYGDVVPRTNLGHWVAAMVMVLIIPVWTLSFSFFSSWLVSMNLHIIKEDIKDYTEKRLRHHVGNSEGEEDA